MSATGRGSKRILQDAYQTPEYCIELIFDRIKWSGIHSFLEPCRGDNNIYNKIPNNIITFWCEIKEDRDYLNFKFPYTIDLIITNPPYSLAQEFIEKSLAEARTIVYLLRLDFFGSIKRHEFWIRNTPTHLYVLSKRPSFIGKGTDANNYGWFVWDSADLIEDKPGIYFL